MEDYPEELRTPPVTLISLVGCPDLHSLISTHLHSEQPPINTLALPDFSKISIMARSPAKTLGPSFGGILKRDWLLKHRTKVPAVVAALFSSHHISGDPAQWLQVCTDLENLKTITRRRNIKLVLVVVQSSTLDELSEDRMIALRKRAEVESKHVIIFNNATDLSQSLNRLGSTFAELANTYYRDEGRRFRTHIEKKTSNSIELNVRYCFKVAVYAEFRRDWVEALRFYEDAYYTLREMIGTSTRLPVVQRLVEIKSVGEQLHFKISTLLLHGGKLIEAVTWFRRHNASYSRLTGAPEVMFLHCEWMSRQFLAFAELLETSSGSSQSMSSVGIGIADGAITEWEYRPAYYYQLAAQYLKDKRSCLELALSMLETATELEDDAGSVVPSVYVGQFARLLEQGAELVMQPLSDEDYIRYTLAEGKRFKDSFEIVALFKRSCELFSNHKAHRMVAYCRYKMAREYFSAGDFSNAKQLFDSVSSLYRQEGWADMLWEVLEYLRECTRSSSLKDFIEYSLEMAALPTSSGLDVQSSQRPTIYDEVIAIARGESDCFSVTEDHPVHLEIDLVSPLRVVLLASVAFHEPSVKPGASTMISVSLLSQLPRTLEIDRLEIQFNQSECNFSVANAASAAGSDACHRGLWVETAPALALPPNRWLRLTYCVKPGHSGKLECLSVVARIGSYFKICCRAESPASLNDLTLRKFEGLESYPTLNPALTFSGQKAIQVEEVDPLVDLNLGASGPALVGEVFVVPVTVASKGHCIYGGELKVNLVDSRGGSLVSARESEPFSMENSHVEIIGIAEPEPKDDPQSQTGSTSGIKKVQQVFGLISVPFLNNGDLWSCKFELKWHRPKPIMLYVSLSYSPQGSDESSTVKLHVHRSLHIEGKTSIVISHQLMQPFCQAPLLPSRRMKPPVPDSSQLVTLPLTQRSILTVGAKNCSELPLRLLSLSIEAEADADTDDVGGSCLVQHGGEIKDAPLLTAGEEFKKVFAVIPEEVNSTKHRIGTVCLRWERVNVGSGTTASPEGVLTKYKLPDVSAEMPPLVVSLECPPHAILGHPFMYYMRIQNQTELLQEIRFSLVDSQSFLLSGSHDDTVFVLPRSEHILRYKLVPLASGSQQLPRVTVTAVRYSAGFQPPVASASVFVFPSRPNFQLAQTENTRIMESVASK